MLFLAGRFFSIWSSSAHCSLNVMDGLSIKLLEQIAQQLAGGIDRRVDRLKRRFNNLGLELQFFGVQRYLSFDQFDSLIAGELFKFKVIFGLRLFAFCVAFAASSIAFF